MPLFLLPAIPVATKAAAIAVAKVVGTIALSAGTIYAPEYARSAAKNRASKKNADDVYNEEYKKRKAQKDAERDARNES